MQYAILSDIHSNLPALTRALSIIQSSGIDRILCLGDIVGYGAHPNECVSLLKEHAEIAVMGNHDLAATDPREARYFNDAGRTAAEWTSRILTAENISYLSSLPYCHRSDLFTLVHGSPENPEYWNYILSVQSAGRQFNFFDTKYCFIGHTHVPAVCGEDLETFSFNKDGRFLINVGSVGQPRDGNPKLSFGLLDTDEWSFEIVRAEYDVKQAANSILEAGLPPFLADRLFKGR